MPFTTRGHDEVIFLSYRRDDAGAAAGRLYDRLVTEFGPRRVFIDVDALTPGDNATEILVRAINASNAILVIIGPNWLNGHNRHQRLMSRPYDPIRVEVETGLTRGIRVIPILVDGASMPKATDLPPSLAPLIRRTPIALRHDTFLVDSNRLVTELRASATSTRSTRRMKLFLGVATVLVLLVAVTLWIIIASG